MTVVTVVTPHFSLNQLLIGLKDTKWFMLHYIFVVFLLKIYLFGNYALLDQSNNNAIVILIQMKRVPSTKPWINNEDHSPMLQKHELLLDEYAPRWPNSPCSTELCLIKVLNVSLKSGVHTLVLSKWVIIQALYKLQ